MRENIDDRQMMDFELLTASEELHYEADLTIYFVLNGTMTVRIPEAELVLEEKDFVIINPFGYHALELGDVCLAMKFLLNPGKVSEYYDISKLDFVGNSVEEESGHHVALRELLEKCAVCYYGKRARNGRILLKLNSLYYQIAELLISSFSVEK